MALTDNLIALWELEEASGTRVDAHGSNDLTDNNTVGQGTGKVGNCADLELSNNESLSIADNPSLSCGDIDFTAAAWVNFESAGTMHVMGKWETAAGQAEWRCLSLASNFTFRIASAPGAENAVSATSVTISTGTWYFVVVWHDSVANTMNIQVNNGTVHSQAHSAGVQDSTASFRIGMNDAGLNVLDGLIDQVGFWKRVLTSDERTELYNSGDGLAYSAMGGGGLSIPIAYHHYKQLMVNA